MLVQFRLNADLILSGEIPGEAKDAIEASVAEANGVLFKKGVPAGVAEDEIGHITEWSISENRLVLTIESGPYTRAHDALLRFRKHATPVFGKFRLGIRGIMINEFSLSIDGDLPDGAIPKLPQIVSSEREDDRIVLRLNVETADLEKKIPDRLFRLIEEKIENLAYGGKTEHWEQLFESKKRTGVYSGNPTEEMVRRNWIRHGASRGQWIFGPRSVQLIRALEEIALEEIIRPLGFKEMIFPKLVPWEVWKHSGHTKGLYPEIYYVCAPKSRDPAYWEEVTDYYKVTGEVPLDMIRDRIDPPLGGMCYAQCPPFWPYVQGETLATDSLPVRIFDRSGTSHRYESGGIHGIERVDEFHRVEIVWIGTAEQTVQVSEQLHEAYRRVFEEVLELEWRCARVTPWFMAQEGLLGVSENEKIGTMDYEAYLPYNGSYLEFQNVSVNGNKYPKGFNVKIQSNEECWSGCSGIGLERWTAAFLAQKGFDTDNWPEEVVKRVGDPEEAFAFL